MTICGREPLDGIGARPTRPR